MDNRMKKGLICLLPLIIAGGLWFGLLSPAFDAIQETDKQLDEKKQEQQVVEGQLSEKKKLEKKKTVFEAEIASLRSAVPKNPDLDILNIDLEKMCLDSGMDVIAFQPPDNEALKAAGITKESKEKEPKADSDQSGNKGKKTDSGSTEDSKDSKAKSSKGKTSKDKSKKDKSKDSEVGLKKQLVQVKITGDYPSLIDLVQKLETYQRVVDLTMVQSFIPKKKKQEHELPEESPAGEDEDLGDPKQLFVSLLLTAYYLP